MTSCNTPLKTKKEVIVTCLGEQVEYRSASIEESTTPCTYYTYYSANPEVICTLLTNHQCSAVDTDEENHYRRYCPSLDSDRTSFEQLQNFTSRNLGYLLATAAPLVSSNTSIFSIGIIVLIFFARKLCNTCNRRNQGRVGQPDSQRPNPGSCITAADTSQGSPHAEQPTETENRNTQSSRETDSPTEEQLSQQSRQFSNASTAASASSIEMPQANPTPPDVTLNLPTETQQSQEYLAEPSPWKDDAGGTTTIGDGLNAPTVDTLNPPTEPQQSQVHPAEPSPGEDADVSTAVIKCMVRGCFNSLKWVVVSGLWPAIKVGAVSTKWVGVNALWPALIATPRGVQWLIISISRTATQRIHSKSPEGGASTASLALNKQPTEEGAVPMVLTEKEKTVVRSNDSRSQDLPSTETDDSYDNVSSQRNHISNCSWPDSPPSQASLAAFGNTERLGGPADAPAPPQVNLAPAADESPGATNSDAGASAVANPIQALQSSPAPAPATPPANIDRAADTAAQPQEMPPASESLHHADMGVLAQNVAAMDDQKQLGAGAAFKPTDSPISKADIVKSAAMKVLDNF